MPRKNLAPPVSDANAAASTTSSAEAREDAGTAAMDSEAVGVGAGGGRLGERAAPHAARPNQGAKERT